MQPRVIQVGYVTSVERLIEQGKWVYPQMLQIVVNGGASSEVFYVLPGLEHPTVRPTIAYGDVELKKTQTVILCEFDPKAPVNRPIEL